MYLRYGDVGWDAGDGGVEPTVAAAPAHNDPKPRYGRSLRNERLPMVRLNGVAVHAITEDQCVQYILKELREGRGGTVVTPNLDHLRRCQTDLNFGALVAEADVVVADGMPLVWASKLQGTPLPQRVAGSDLISSLSAGAARENRSLFLWGGDPGTAAGAAAVLRERHPNLRIGGIICPAYGFEKDDRQMAGIVNAIAEAKPDLVYVCLGSPKQEKLIQRIRPMAAGAWWLGLGNSFSFLCGDVRRAPRWMQKIGLEWVHRLLQEPKRLFKRYIVQGIPFAAKLLGQSALAGAPMIGGGAVMEPAEPESGPRDAAPGAAVEASKSVDASRGASSERTPRISSGAAVDLGRLRAVILLGGSVRPTPLTSHIGRAVLDLPLDDRRTLLHGWLGQVRELGSKIGLGELPVRVLVNRGTSDPASGNGGSWPELRVERDFAEYRGTGGVLGDVAWDYRDDDLILVANASQLLLDPLHRLAVAMAETRGQVCLVGHQDGTPSGLMLLTCGALRMIPGTGFVDMKEQAMPAIASNYEVTVVQRRRPTGLPIRTLAEYITALRHEHRGRLGSRAGGDPLDESWQPAFSLVEAGATVEGGARVHDSVVLSGATVESGAVLVRSVACSGCRVRHDATAVDQYCTMAGEGNRKGA